MILFEDGLINCIFQGLLGKKKKPPTKIDESVEKKICRTSDALRSS